METRSAWITYSPPHSLPSSLPPLLPAAPHLFVAEAPALGLQEARDGPEDGDLLHQPVLHLHVVQDFLVWGGRKGGREEGEGHARKRRKELENMAPHPHKTYSKCLALEDGVKQLEGVHAAGLLHGLEKGQLARRAHGVQDWRKGKRGEGEMWMGAVGMYRYYRVSFLAFLHSTNRLPWTP